MTGGATTTLFSEKQQHPGTDNIGRKGSGRIDLLV
jgi:hypothetical protein